MPSEAPPSPPTMPPKSPPHGPRYAGLDLDSSPPASGRSRSRQRRSGSFGRGTGPNNPPGRGDRRDPRRRSTSRPRSASLARNGKPRRTKDEIAATAKQRRAEKEQEKLRKAEEKYEAQRQRALEAAQAATAAGATDIELASQARLLEAARRSKPTESAWTKVPARSKKKTRGGMEAGDAFALNDEASFPSLSSASKSPQKKGPGSNKRVMPATPVRPPPASSESELSMSNINSSPPEGLDSPPSRPSRSRLFPDIEASDDGSVSSGEELIRYFEPGGGADQTRQELDAKIAEMRAVVSGQSLPPSSSPADTSSTDASMQQMDADHETAQQDVAADLQNAMFSPVEEDDREPAARSESKGERLRREWREQRAAEAWEVRQAEASEEASKKAAIAAAAREAELKWEREATARREAEQQAWSEEAAQMRAADAAAKAARAAEHLALEEQAAARRAGRSSDADQSSNPPEGSLKSPPELLLPTPPAPAPHAPVVEEVQSDDEFMQADGSVLENDPDIIAEETLLEQNSKPAARPDQSAPPATRDPFAGSAALASNLRAAMSRPGMSPPVASVSLGSTTTPSTLGTDASSSTSTTLPRPDAPPPDMPAGGRRSNLRQSSYAGTAHNEIPEMEWEELDRTAWKIESMRAGAPGRSWLCELNLLHKDGVSATDLLLGGLRASFDIAAAAIPMFRYLPLDEQSPLPELTTTAEGSAFPETCAAAYPYVKCRNLRTQASSGPQVAQPTGPHQRRKFDDDAPYTGPSQAYCIVRVRGEADLKEAFDFLAFDLDEIGISLRLKAHQAVDAQRTFAIVGLHPSIETEGTAVQFHYYCEVARKTLIKHGKLDHNLVDKPIPAVTFRFKNQRNGQKRNKAEEELSLNKLPGFEEFGCRWMEGETSAAEWPFLSVLVNQMIKSGAVKTVFGRRSKLVILTSGMMTRHMLQRLRRFHFVYTQKLELIILPGVINPNKLVEVRYTGEDGRTTKKQPPGTGPRNPKFTSVLKEMMSLTYTNSKGEEVPVLQYLMPSYRGLRAGSSTAAVMSDDPEALRIARQLALHPCGFMNGVLRQKRYAEGVLKSLNESYDLEDAMLSHYIEYDPATRTISGDFLNDDGYLDEVEAEMGISLSNARGDDIDDGTPFPSRLTLEGAQEALRATLHDRDDLSAGDRSAASRRTNFSQSTGNSSNRSENTARVMLHHRDRALQNRELVTQNADMSARIREMEEQAEAREAETSQRLAEMERLRAELENLRSTNPTAAPATVNMAMVDESDEVLDPAPRNSVTFGQDDTAMAPERGVTQGTGSAPPAYMSAQRLGSTAAASAAAAQTTAAASAPAAAAAKVADPCPDPAIRPSLPPTKESASLPPQVQEPAPPAPPAPRANVDAVAEGGAVNQSNCSAGLKCMMPSIPLVGPDGKQLASHHCMQCGKPNHGCGFGCGILFSERGPNVQVRGERLTQRARKLLSSSQAIMCLNCLPLCTKIVEASSSSRDPAKDADEDGEEV